MKIAILCGAKTHPVVGHVRKWVEKHAKHKRSIHLDFSHENIPSSEVLFVLSYGRLLSKQLINKFNHVIVLHASDLPKGRGWSPYVWEILAGADHIILSAITAAERVDEGDIWAKMRIEIAPTDTYLDINEKLFSAEMAIMERVLEMIENGEAPTPQSSETATYYPKRVPEDSQVSLNNTLGEIFNLLRVADPYRYPVFFEKDGVRFNLFLRKNHEDHSN